MNSRTTYKFEPKPDIQTYEIAELLPFLIAEWKNANGPTTIIGRQEVSANLIGMINGSKPHLRKHFSPPEYS